MELISQETIQLLNYRIAEEEKSSRLYESMGLYLKNIGMSNTGKLFCKFAIEEMKHAKWSKDYLLNLGLTPELDELEAPINIFNGVEDILQKTLEHEILITKQCKELAAHAMLEADYMLFTLSQKYLAEQVEELDKARNLLDAYRLTSDNLVFDHHVPELFA